MLRALAIILLSLLSLPAMAEGLWKYGPTMPEATGEPHPQGNEFMRKYHMELMKHDRDLTMYDGIRETDGSLKACFDCHTVKDEETGDPVTYEDERHFCRTCHDYAAVKVDCFMCHRSTPEGFEEPGLLHSRLLELRNDLSDDAITEIAAYIVAQE